MKKALIQIILAGVWITISEFVRNEILLKTIWEYHFHSLGLSFRTLPVNGVLWTVWSFVLAYIIYKLLQKFSFKETLLMAWLPAFLMMWIAIYNLQVFPPVLLMSAAPLSILEVAVAAYIIRKT